MAGLTFDTDFTPTTGSTSTPASTAAAATCSTSPTAPCSAPTAPSSTRSPTFQLDYGAFFGGGIEDGVGNPLPDANEVLDFSGDRVDLPGSPALFTEYAPRQTPDRSVQPGARV
jgi:hypothetical protein